MFHSKIIIIVCLGLIAVVCADDSNEDIGMTCDEMVDALEPMAEQCPITPSREDIKAMIQNDENCSYNSKCFRRCCMEQFDVMKEGETKLNVDKACEMLGMVFPDGKDELKDIIIICNDINAGITDPCDNAHAHGMCVIKHLKERGYKIPRIE